MDGKGLQEHTLSDINSVLQVVLQADLRTIACSVAILVEDTLPSKLDDLSQQSVEPSQTFWPRILLCQGA